MTKEYYAAHSDKIKETAKQWTIKQRQKLRDLIINLKADRQCNRCRGSYPWYVMTLGDKDIVGLVRKGVSMMTLHESIKDKDILCANCRRISDSENGTLTDRESLA